MCDIFVATTVGDSWSRVCLCGWANDHAECGGDVVCRYAKTGDPVIKLTSGGVHVEGDVLPFVGNLKDAVSGWQSAFQKYLQTADLELDSERPATIYWRMRPTIRYDAVEDKVVVVARLLLTYKHELSDEEYAKLCG